ncbi:ATP-binding cassette domain-containing protein [Gardnerella sp. DNF01180P]|uniref:ATP-binding cassette domain-containing protein n=1 Tax=Gardnerella sp. DNF01180P TaxID=2749062 RepID=UPI003BA8808C
MKDSKTLLEAKELGLKRFRRTPFWDVSLKVEAHQIVAISGEHGSGKSALLLALSGYMKFTNGTLTIADATLPSDFHESRQYVGLGLFNGINEFYKMQTIEEVLMSELKLAARSPLFLKQYKNDVKNREALQQYAYNVLAQWKVLSPRKTAIGELTPCERMRLAIALALLKKPWLLFVDGIETELTSEQSECLFSDIRAYVSKNYCSCLVGVLQSELEKQADQVLRLSPNHGESENSHIDSQLGISEANGGENNAR